MNISIGSTPLNFLGKARRSSFGVGTMLFLMLFGALFIGLSTIFLQDDMRSRGWPTVTGNVETFTTGRDSDGDTTYTSTVRYAVDGETYIVTSKISTGNRPAVGDERTVAYNPADPSDGALRTSGSERFIYLFPIIGALVFLTGPIGYVLSLRRTRAIQSLVQRGIKVTGVVSDVRYASSNGNAGSCRLVVSATDPTGQVRDYISDPIAGNTFGLIDFRTQPVPIDVYLDPSKPDTYYVDISDIPSLTPEKIAAMIQGSTGGAATPSSPHGTPPSTPLS